MKYGFYSAEAHRSAVRMFEMTLGGDRRNRNGSSVYLTPDGREVVVTSVSTDPEGEAYKWADKQVLGEVVKWLRDGPAPEVQP